MKIVLKSGNANREKILDLFDEIEPQLVDNRDEFDSDPFERLVDVCSNVLRDADPNYMRPSAARVPSMRFRLLQGFGGRKVAVNVAQVRDIVEETDDVGKPMTRIDFISNQSLRVSESVEVVFSRLNTVADFKRV